MTSGARVTIAASLTTAVLLAGQAFSGVVPVAAASEPSSSITRTPEAPDRDDPAAVMVPVDVADFVDEAAALPRGLVEALDRDAGLTGAEWLAQSEVANNGADVVAQLSDEIEIVDARLKGYDLVVTVETSADARLVEAVGGVAELGRASDRSATVIDGLEPTSDLRGGTPYIYPEGSGTSRCSVGLVGINTATKRIEMISAGHCQGVAGSLRQAANSSAPTVSGGTVSGPFTSIGTAGLHVAGQYPNPGFSDPTYYDLGLTPVTASGWTPRPEVVTWGGSTTGAPLASAPMTIRDAGPALVGSTVCKSGATTGWTCGAITGVDQILPVGGSVCAAPNYCVGGIVADICVRGGDSGGPATVGTRAVGISSASNQTIGGCAPGDVGVFATLYSVDPALEVVSKIWSSWEPLIGVQAPTVSQSGRLLSGVVAHGSPRHRVEVRLCGGDVLSSTVAINGSWSVDTTASDAFPQTFWARAAWGNGSVSPTVSGTLPGTGLACIFWDVLPSRAFASQIAWLASSGVTNGYSDGSFRPLGTVNRDAMAAFLYRFAGSPAFTAPAVSPFTDVTPSTPFYKEISWLAQSGITGGFSDGSFRPGLSVNRDAMAAFLYRFAGEPTFTPPAVSPFADVNLSTPFYKEITWLASTEVTGGFSDGTFRAGQPVNRDAMAAFLFRFDDKGLPSP